VGRHVYPRTVVSVS